MKAFTAAMLALVFVLMATPVSAQDEAGMPDQVVTFFEELADISAGIPDANQKQGQCKTVGDKLNAYLDEKGEVLNNAAFSVEEASEEQEMKIMVAAKVLGDKTGKCYDNQEVKDFVDRFIMLTSSVGGNLQ